MPLLGAIGAQLWRGCRSCRSWVPLLGQTFGEVVVAAVPGCHCCCRSWAPLLLPFLGAIACWAPLGRNFGEVVLAAVPGCHCWVPLGRSFGEVVVAAVPGGCHCCCRSWVPLLGAIGTQLWRGCRSCMGAIAGCDWWIRLLARLS